MTRHHVFDQAGEKRGDCPAGSPTDDVTDKRTQVHSASSGSRERWNCSLQNLTADTTTDSAGDIVAEGSESSVFEHGAQSTAAKCAGDDLDQETEHGDYKLHPTGYSRWVAGGTSIRPGQLASTWPFPATAAQAGKSGQTLSPISHKSWRMGGVRALVDGKEWDP